MAHPAVAATPPAPNTAAYQACMRAARADAQRHDCLAEEYARQDKALNLTYRAVMVRLDAAAQTRLRQDERAWLKATKRRCDNPGPDLEGSAAPLAIDACYIDATRQRIAILQAMAKKPR